MTADVYGLAGGGFVAGIVLAAEEIGLTVGDRLTPLTPAEAEQLALDLMQATRGAALLGERHTTTGLTPGQLDDARDLRR